MRLDCPASAEPKHGSGGHAAIWCTFWNTFPHQVTGHYTDANAALSHPFSAIP